MCLIVFAYKKHPKYPFILLANRDEFYDRPTRAAEFWDDFPQVFAGRDLQFGGTWLGITKSGRFAALTNYREVRAEQGEISRGKLVGDFLTSNISVSDYLSDVEYRSNNFSGFNLVAGEFAENSSELGYFSNRGDSGIVKFEAGIFGLSNHLLDTPWKKVSQAKNELEKLIKPQLEPDPLFEILQSRTIADDGELPETGVGIERERILSPIFIETPHYGTRCSSLVLFEEKKGLSLDERVFR